MEKVFGPVSGYFVVVSVTPASGSEEGFSASYRICPDAPGGDSKASTAIQKRVAGLSRTAGEAFDIALQLARLQLAGLRSRVAEAAAPERKSKPTLAEFAKSWCEEGECDASPMTYEPTMACPLEPRASGGA